MALPNESQPVLVSANVYAGCVEVAAQNGFDITPYLLRYGIDPDFEGHAQGFVSFLAMNDCLEDIARSQNCPDFGFQLGKSQPPLQFGIISQLVKFAPDIGEAIKIILKYRAIYSPPSHWELREEDGVAYIRRYHQSAKLMSRPQALIHTLTHSFEAIKRLADDKWNPIGLYISTDEATVTTAMRRHFKIPIFYNAPHDEIAFQASDLAHPIATSDPTLLAALTEYFDRLLPDYARYQRISAQVAKLLRAKMGSGNCTLDSVARHFSMHPRKLQRALTNEGTTFRKLEHDVRIQIAMQLIENTNMPLSDIAPLAGYQHLSSLSRAVHAIREDDGRSLQKRSSRNDMYKS
jgi:AraC-like DNA-binding protein